VVRGIHHDHFIGHTPLIRAFLQPMSLSNEWGREVFAFSIAMQNLVWGVAQPFVGRMADRLGSAITMILGGLCTRWVCF